jgi:competence protein CoiA
MRFAIVNDERREALPKSAGACPACGSPVVAKCGRIKAWHWAHKGRQSCDRWWENETDWHRRWKAEFPISWQEVPQQDRLTGEWHFADVKTDEGLVLEFQHSPLDPVELQSREAFYGNLVWVVDGNRKELDKSYFNMGLSGPVQEDPLAYAVKWWSRSRLLHDWAATTAPVYLDFGDEFLWRLIFYRPETRLAAVGPLLRSAFVEDCLTGRPIHLLAKAAPEPGNFG